MNMKLKNPIFLLFVILICSIMISCSTKYPIISVNKISELKKNKSIPHKKYIILPEPLKSDNPSMENEILYSLYLIKNNKYKELEGYISTMSNSDESIKTFCDGIYSFFKGNYISAYQNLSDSKITNYKYLKYLLIGDCMLELNKNPISKKFSDNEILYQFQKSMDYCEIEEIRDVIKIHVKYAKYGG